MAFLSNDTGEILFRDRLLLGPDTTEEQLAQLGIIMEDGNGCRCLKPHPVRGGALAPVLTLENGTICAITLHVAMIGIRQDADADRQRGFLFQTLGLKDPCPDTRSSVRIAYPFGEVFLYTDPYTGFSCARIAY